MQKFRILAVLEFVIASNCVGATTSVDRAADANAGITVATYYFGNYHPDDPRNDERMGKGWTEWKLVERAKPRFPGHQQPKVPAWGYTNESDPNVMAQKIAAAADHGIDAFIFDWYYFDDGPFLRGALESGFLRAPNHNRLKFAVMWANEDWIDIFPVKHGVVPKIFNRGRVTPETFQRIGDYLIRFYFRNPDYWRVNGKPYFSIYDLESLVASFGSVRETRAALDQLRFKAKVAGLPGLHLNAVAWGTIMLPKQQAPVDVGKLVSDLGFDSVTSYTWAHHVQLPKLQSDYSEARDQYFAYWDRAKMLFKIPYYPNVTMGWDGTPRAYEVMGGGNTLSGNTPARFREALQLTKERLLAEPNGQRVLNINAWNEWTEGSYLEPDKTYGMQYLEAVRDVFADQHPLAAGR